MAHPTFGGNMPDYDNKNSGALFRNDRKTNDKQPTHTGNLETECPHCQEKSEWWVSAWTRKAKSSGKTFFSLAVTEKEEQGNAEPAEGFDDDIPF